MKNKRKLLLKVLWIILSLLLLVACKAETLPDTVLEGSAETVKDEQLQGQSQEQLKDEAFVDASTEVIKGTKPAEPEKSADSAPKDVEVTVKEISNTEISLQIGGSGAEKSIMLTLDELKAMKEACIEDDFFSLNSYGTKEYFHFKGIKLRAVLEKAGLKKSAATITFVASDGYKQEITIEQALKEDYIDEQNSGKKYPIIIAWNENGKDYDAEEGAPFRLVIGQKEPGDINKPQWVQNIAKIIVD